MNLKDEKNKHLLYMKVIEKQNILKKQFYRVGQLVFSVNIRE